MGAPGAFRRRPAGFVKQIDPSPRHRLDLIPNFCEARPVLALAFIMAVVAAVLTQSSSAVGETALQRWLLISIYLQWIGICSAATLCWARRWLRYARAGVVCLVRSDEGGVGK